MALDLLESEFIPSEAVLKSQIYRSALRIANRLRNKGFECYFVGGVVRDFLLNPDRVPKDIDLATSARPEEIVSLFPQAQWVGKSFGVFLIQGSGLTHEVASFRKDGTYTDRRHPDQVTVGTMREDSCRRDFTINALYFDPILQSIFDFHGGLKDVSKKMLRCVGDPEQRIFEDTLRILRAFRFAANDQLTIDQPTLDALQKHALGIQELSKERILEEVRKVRASRFEDFVAHLQAHLALSSLFALPEEAVIQKSRSPVQQRKKWDNFRTGSDFHRRFPFTALALATLFYNKIPLETLVQVGREWPLMASDRAMISQCIALMRILNGRLLTSYHFDICRWIQLQKDFTLNDFRSLAEEFVTPEMSLFVYLITQKRKEQVSLKNLLEELIANVPALVTDANELKDFIVEQGYPKEYIGVWLFLERCDRIASALKLDDVRTLNGDRMADLKRVKEIYKQFASSGFKV